MATSAGQAGVRAGVGALIGSYIFFTVIAFSDLFSAGEGNRADTSAARARGLDRAWSTFVAAAGGTFPSSSAANPKLAQATCFHLLREVRNSVGPNGALFGELDRHRRTEAYLSSGIASAAARNSYS